MTHVSELSRRPNASKPSATTPLTCGDPRGQAPQFSRLARWRPHQKTRPQARKTPAHGGRGSRAEAGGVVLQERPRSVSTARTPVSMPSSTGSTNSAYTRRTRDRTTGSDATASTKQAKSRCATPAPPSSCSSSHLPSPPKMTRTEPTTAGSVLADVSRHDNGGEGGI